MPFPPSGPAGWRSEEPQWLWAWSSQAGDTRAGGQPLPKGMGASLSPLLRVWYPDGIRGQGQASSSGPGEVRWAVLPETGASAGGPDGHG